MTEGEAGWSSVGVWWQKSLDCLYHPCCGRFRWRRKPIDEMAVRTDQIFMEVPTRLAGKSDLTRGPAIERVRGVAFDLNLVRHREVDAVIDLAERADLICRTWLLATEIV